MAGKDNYQARQRWSNHQIHHYALRKLSIGVASVLLGTSVYTGLNEKVHAATNDEPTEPNQQLQSPNVTNPAIGSSSYTLGQHSSTASQEANNAAKTATNSQATNNLSAASQQNSEATVQAQSATQPTSEAAHNNQMSTAKEASAASSASTTLVTARADGPVAPSTLQNQAYSTASLPASTASGVDSTANSAPSTQVDNSTAVPSSSASSSAETYIDDTNGVPAGYMDVTSAHEDAAKTTMQATFKWVDAETSAELKPATTFAVNYQRKIYSHDGQLFAGKWVQVGDPVITGSPLQGYSKNGRDVGIQRVNGNDYQEYSFTWSFNLDQIERGYSLNSSSMSFTFMLPINYEVDIGTEPPKVEKIYEKVAPTAQAGTVTQNGALNPSSLITNTDQLIPGTTFAFQTPLDTSTLGEKPVMIIATYPDHTTKTVNTSVTVKIKQVSVTYRFVDPNGHLVATPYVITGDAGSYQSFGFRSAPKVPTGYHLASGTSLPFDVEFGDQDQTIDLPVVKDAQIKLQIIDETPQHDLTQYDTLYGQTGQEGQPLKKTPTASQDLTFDADEDTWYQYHDTLQQEIDQGKLTVVSDPNNFVGTTTFPEHDGTYVVHVKENIVHGTTSLSAPLPVSIQVDQGWTDKLQNYLKANGLNYLYSLTPEASDSPELKELKSHLHLTSGTTFNNDGGFAGQSSDYGETGLTQSGYVQNGPQTNWSGSYDTVPVNVTYNAYSGNEQIQFDLATFNEPLAAVTTPAGYSVQVLTPKMTVTTEDSYTNYNWGWNDPSNDQTFWTTVSNNQLQPSLTKGQYLLDSLVVASSGMADKLSINPAGYLKTGFVNLGLWNSYQYAFNSQFNGNGPLQMYWSLATGAIQQGSGAITVNYTKDWIPSHLSPMMYDAMQKVNGLTWQNYLKLWSTKATDEGRASQNEPQIQATGQVPFTAVTFYSLQANDQTTHIKYVDPQGNPVKTDTVTGKTDETVPVHSTIPAGWVPLDSDQVVPSTITFNGNGTPDIIIKIKHGITPVSPENPVKPGTKTPADRVINGAHENDLNKTITRTIKVTDPTGTTTTTKQPTHLTRTASYDDVTGDVTYGSWNTGSWAEFNTPVINGYVPSQVSVPAEEVTSDTKNTEVDINYSPLTSKTGIPATISKPAYDLTKLEKHDTGIPLTEPTKPSYDLTKLQKQQTGQPLTEPAKPAYDLTKLRRQQTGQPLTEPNKPSYDLTKLERQQTGQPLTEPAKPSYDLTKLQKHDTDKPLIEPLKPAYDLTKLQKQQTGEPLVEPTKPSFDLTKLQKHQTDKPLTEPAKPSFDLTKLQKHQTGSPLVEPTKPAYDLTKLRRHKTGEPLTEPTKPSFDLTKLRKHQTGKPLVEPIKPSFDLTKLRKHNTGIPLVEPTKPTFNLTKLKKHQSGKPATAPLKPSFDLTQLKKHQTSQPSAQPITPPTDLAKLEKKSTINPQGLLKKNAGQVLKGQASTSSVKQPRDTRTALPQTGNEHSKLWFLFGLSLISLLALGLRRRRTK